MMRSEWWGRRVPWLPSLLRQVVETDGHADVAWEADVDTQVNQPLLPRPCRKSKWEKGLVSKAGCIARPW